MKTSLLRYLPVLAVSLTVFAANAQTEVADSSAKEPSTIKLWPGKAPGSEDWTFSEKVSVGPGGSKTYSNVVDPTLTVYLPDPEKANGAAIILCPGGAMRMLGFAETEQTAEWLNAKGIAAFILKYRVVPDQPISPAADRPAGPRRAPGGMMGMGGELSFREILSRNGNANPAPDNPDHLKVIQMAIADGQQAIRILRRDAAKYNINPERIGILGFSAGGGVAIGTAVTESEDGMPNFVATVYGPSLVDVKVPEDGAPLFVAVMDGHFNVTNGCMVLAALWKEANRPVEMHLYDHGNGAASGMPISSWTDRLYDWLQRRGMVTK